MTTTDLTPEQLAERLEARVSRIGIAGNYDFAIDLQIAAEMLRAYDEMLYDRKSMVTRREALED